MIDTLKNRVLKILEKYPKTRDSDIKLTLTLWMVYYPSRIHKETPESPAFVYLRDIIDLPREDNIKRVRAIIQNIDNKFLPTSLEVAKQRKINEEVWREYIKNNS